MNLAKRACGLKRSGERTILAYGKSGKTKKTSSTPRKKKGKNPGRATQGKL